MSVTLVMVWLVSYWQPIIQYQSFPSIEACQDAAKATERLIGEIGASYKRRLHIAGWCGLMLTAPQAKPSLFGFLHAANS